MTNPGKVMLQGLAAILPALLTIYILYWLGTTAETFLGGIIRVILPQNWYRPGMGLLAGVAVVYGAGLMLQGWFARRMLAWSDKMLNRIPLVKTVYGSVKDLIGFFASDKGKQFGEVVTVELASGETRIRLLGFVTRTDFRGLPDELGDDDMIAVYMPMSYQIGGYTLIVPRTSVRSVPMSKQQAMRFALTAGMSTEENEKQT